MRLSIILPCYNVDKYLSETLNSLKMQSEAMDCEIIVVDDGSKDNTFQLAKNLLKGMSNTLVIAKPNGGVSSARNLGLAHASGDYVYFLDGDDLVDSTLFENLNNLKSFPDAIFWNYKYEYSSGKYKKIQLFDSSNLLLDYLYLKAPMHLGSIIFKRQLLVKNSLLFDENTSYGEDREFIVRGLFYSKTRIFIDKCLFVYKWRMNSAVHVKKDYDAKKYSSIESAQRVYDFFLSINNPEYINASLFYFCIEMMSNKKQLLLDESNAYNLKLDNLLFKYLPLYKISLMNKFAIFLSLAKISLSISRGCFYKFLKLSL